MTLATSLGSLLTAQGTTYVWKQMTAYVDDGYGARVSETQTNTNITGILGEITEETRKLLPEGLARREDRILFTTTSMPIEDVVTISSEDWKIIHKMPCRDLLASNAIFGYSYLIRRPE